MKKLLIGSVLSAGLLLAGSVQAESYDKRMEADLIKICEAIKSDSKLRLNRAIKRSGIKAKAISQGLVCNGYDPVTFAMLNNAESTARYMAKKGDVDYEALLAKL